MSIKYLQELDNLNFQSLGRTLGNRPMLTTEILALEQQFNNSKPFPAVLRELLLIAGNGCPIIDVKPLDLQQKIRARLVQKGHIISSPFFGFDYRDGGSFSMVYTDENTYDPEVYHVELDPSEDEHTEFIEDSEFTLLRLLKHRVNQIKKGYSPY